MNSITTVKMSVYCTSVSLRSCNRSAQARRQGRSAQQRARTASVRWYGASRAGAKLQEPIHSIQAEQCDIYVPAAVPAAFPAAIPTAGVLENQCVEDGVECVAEGDGGEIYD